MTPYEAEVLVQDDKRRQISVTLNPIPKPLNVAQVLWITGGAALLAGSVVVGVATTARRASTDLNGTFQREPIQLSVRGRWWQR
jgi:hypothetical protein